MPYRLNALSLGLTLVLAGSLAACKPATNETASAPAQPAAPAAAPVSGIDLTGLDKTVKPGDDFDAFANGGWRKTFEIPADRSNYGAFTQLLETAEKRNAELIAELSAGKPAAGTDARRIADFHTAYMDEAGTEKRGLQSLQPRLDAIGAIASRGDLSRVFGAGIRADTDPLNSTNFHTDNLFGVFVAKDLQEPAYVATLMQGGLGMPDREYYLSSDKEMVETRKKYETYVIALLKQAGIADADSKAKAIIALETKIAQAHAPLLDSQNVHKANNPWDTAAFAQRAPGIEWATFFDAAGLAAQKKIVAWQPGAIAGIARLVGSEPLPVWKDYLAFHALDHAAWNEALRGPGELPKAYTDLAFGFHGTALAGTPQARERGKRALDATSSALGDALGKLYAAKYFPAASKAKVEEMVGNILAAFDERVDSLTWMTPQTKAKAREKAKSMRVSVGYPERWRDYASLDIRPDDALGNRLRAELHEYRYQLGKLGQPVDNGEWWMTPQTVNAVQLPLQNAMNFPAAILDKPFFDPNADAAANYGSIGAVIGHEISHGFDDTGAEFDGQGRLANWWTPADTQHFQEATKKLADQYSAYEPLPGLHVNGKQTSGENIADVSGLTIAYMAYRKSLGGKQAPVIDGLSGDQRFFLAYAETWRSKIRDAALRQRILTDGHAPAAQRAQTVRNIDAWYDAWGAKPGEKLYLAPADRIRIW
ncbi:MULTISPECIES: M13 family metallopeptidase [unclassified Lysobacter]|uniref:M13 family metallopeptidase n=1 Tax=unclassified Lysobacter TaxID=2635362 RepID=UPI001BE85F59|nr:MULTISPECIES: M13 family metallopeptidase [unclassified Lysobacter]MBT2747676.1 M13 family metallopeptidase [Lysobacter sp. ISL-42]MBT2752843.1 M13 family metallopeptidase [Lysobacter sp. ISL-50]MBT2779727.1 M13 family metallopeptidase [Lysobacter sp. ISL-54]MBT2780094.1 M13 family metallopeptidase [Lysobacter sp. ISL-52]